MSVFARFLNWLRRWRLIVRLQDWFRKWRRKQAAKRQKASLREFVYLDEVSVYSLIASRLGPIAKEFTDKEVASLKVDVSKVIGGSGEVSSQIVRKSIIQSTFKELYDYEEKSLILHPVKDNLKLPSIQSIDDLLSLHESLAAQGWILDPEKITRGQMLEMEVELDAEETFSVSTVAQALVDIVKDDLDLFGLASSGAFQQVTAMGRILEKLLVGLVPVRGSAVDYRVVNLREKEWIVHCRLLGQLPDIDVPIQYPLFVVGVAEKSLFWKDVRRILFSKARFRILCRVASSGIQRSWSPVKLSHALGSVLPDVGKAVGNMGPELIASVSRASPAKPDADRSMQLRRQALIHYGKLLANHYGYDISEQELFESEVLTDERCNSFDTIEGRRSAFNVIAALILERFDIPKDQFVIAQLRILALFDLGLDYSGEPMPLVNVDDAKPIANQADDDRFLDSEFIAIYW